MDLRKQRDSRHSGMDILLDIFCRISYNRSVATGKYPRLALAHELGSLLLFTVQPVGHTGRGGSCLEPAKHGKSHSPPWPEPAKHGKSHGPAWSEPAKRGKSQRPAWSEPAKCGKSHSPPWAEPAQDGKSHRPACPVGATEDRLMKTAFWDMPGLRWGDPNLRWGDPSYLLEPGDAQSSPRQHATPNLP